MTREKTQGKSKYFGHGFLFSFRWRGQTCVVEGVSVLILDFLEHYFPYARNVYMKGRKFRFRFLRFHQGRRLYESSGPIVQCVYTPVLVLTIFCPRQTDLKGETLYIMGSSGFCTTVGLLHRVVPELQVQGPCVTVLIVQVVE